MNVPLTYSQTSSTTEDTNIYTNTLNGEQFRAFQKLQIFLNLAGGGYFLLSGKAGTGKTYLVARLIEYIQGTMQKPVAITAPTHKAVGVLKGFCSGESFTTHAFLGMREDIDRNGNRIFVPGKAFEIPSERFNIVIVDESSMVADVIFDELEKLVKDRRYKVIFVGDKRQIPPVGYPDSLPFDKPTQKDLGFDMFELEKIVRQAEGNPIIEVASEIREAFLKPYPVVNFQSRVNGLIGVSYIENKVVAEALPDILDMFSSEEFENNADYVKIVAYRNKKVVAYNNIVRKHLFGEVPKIVPGDKLVSDAPLKEGKKIMVPNNTDMTVKNVSVMTESVGGEDIDFYKAHVTVSGYAEMSSELYIRVIHEDSEAIFNDLMKRQAEVAKSYARGSYQSKSAWMDFYALKEKFHAVKHAYAITAHKSQGSTYDHCVVDMKDILVSHNVQERNRILYTACTRPKYSLKIIH